MDLLNQSSQKDSTTQATPPNSTWSYGGKLAATINSLPSQPLGDTLSPQQEQLLMGFPNFYFVNDATV